MKIYAHPLEQRVIVRPSKIMYFNRVAKTGSQSFIALLKKLSHKLGFSVNPKIYPKETLCDTLEGVVSEVDDATKTNVPLVIVRHYSFVDFPMYGSMWSPDWFSMVRDPIDKVKQNSLSYKLLIVFLDCVMVLLLEGSLECRGEEIGLSQ